MRALWLTGLIAMGCESMEATPGRVPPTSAPRPSAADVLDGATVKPVDASAPDADAPTPPADAAPSAGGAPAAAPGEGSAAAPAVDDAAAQAALLAEAFGSAGAPPATPPPAAPGAPPVPAAAPPVATQPPLPTPPPPATAPARAAWAPGTRIEGTWGVRVVSVTPRSNPPRAILGMADGTERVVEPGTMLADEHLVVMAIGEDAVQVSRVVPDGDRVRIESEILTAMYRSAPPAP